MADRLEGFEMDQLEISLLRTGVLRSELSFEASDDTAPNGAVAFVNPSTPGWFTRADLEKLRDWINGRLEETKSNPQPGEVWELKEYAWWWLRKGEPDPHWVCVNAGERTNSECGVDEATPIRRVGRIVYDDE